MDYNNIVLKPSWLGIIDWKKGYYNNKPNTILKNNTLNINKLNINKLNNYNDDNIKNVNDDNTTDTTDTIDTIDTINNNIINNINFDNMLGYYNETKEYIKNNAVFIKPQNQNFYSKEFELLNNSRIGNTTLIKDVFYDIDEDFSMFNIQRKKKKNTKFIIPKIFEDIKNINNNNNNNNKNKNKSVNEINITISNNSNSNNNNNNNEIYSNSDISDNDDSYFEPVKSKKNKK